MPLTFDMTVFELSFYVFFFFCMQECPLQCQNGGTLNAQSCTCSCAVRWAGPDCSGMLHTGKVKRTMFRAVHVVLEVFMSQVLTVHNLSVLLQKYHTKQNPERFLLSHPSASLPWNWVTLRKCSLLDGRY